MPASADSPGSPSPQASPPWFAPAVFAATAFGIGRVPFAPGTFGALLGVPLSFALVRGRFAGATGHPFTGEIVGTGRIGAIDTVTVRVGGRSHYSGEASFSVEPDDPLGGGFLLDRFAPPAG